MADSDEEHDRRRARDKFRRERNDYQERGGGKGAGDERSRREEEWTDRRDAWSGGRDRSLQQPRRDYDQRVRQYSPPPATRRDISPPPKRVRRDWEDNYSSSSRGLSGGDHDGSHRGVDAEREATQPPMQSFKQFLATQDDSIGDEEAVAKYGEYKRHFTRQQLTDFFNTHKDEEWFRWKYHPEEVSRRKKEQEDGLRRRLAVCMELLGSKYFDGVSVDVDKEAEILKFLDAVVIRLEGGSDEDLAVLEEVPPPVEPSNNNEESVEGKSSSKDEADDDKKEMKATDSAMKEKKSEEDGEAEEAAKVKDESDGEEEEGETTGGGEIAAGNGNAKSPENNNGPEEKAEEKEEGGKSLAPSTRAKKHQTCSIYLRNLAPSITRADLEEVCKRYQGFLRVAFADAQPDKRFFRRAWVSFERSVSIKDVCWNLNNVKVREGELSAIVNRDLSRRVRSGFHLAGHKRVARADLRLAVRLVERLDARHSLWSSGEEKKNPLLVRNIAEYLVEETSAEEEQLMQHGSEGEGTGDEGVAYERDDSLLSVLDRLLVYLRVVYSLDYYNASDYPNEDEMPNRCGIMHARPPQPAQGEKVNPSALDEYIESFGTKMRPFLTSPDAPVLSESELTALGKKNADAEVERFVKDNTRELAADKWLCPLSGKKFTAPEFVRKHIVNKHPESLERVRGDAEYFNNYLRDAKRPQLPPYQAKAVATAQAHHHNFHQQQDGGGGGARNYQQQNYQQHNNYYAGNRGYHGGGGGYYPRGGGGYNRGGYYNDRRGFHGSGRRGGREVVNYRDLDAPEASDIF